mmetsp:Transcript_13432/g.31515  ORF Transcript_13432/g.31515 Transcript_13432/m.31515 type:complete len:255 (+) Transcript_13432:196-960(+)
MYSSGRNMYSSVRSLGDRRETYGPPMQSMPMDRSVDYLDLRFRREDELSNLQNELRNSRMEEERIRAAMKTQEHIFARNQEEVAKFRSWMDQRDVEMQRLKDLEERRLQVVLEEYKGRYERERGRLLEALNITAQCTKKVREVLPECLQMEAQLFGPNNLIPSQYMGTSMSGSGQFRAMPPSTTVVHSQYAGQPSQMISAAQPSIQNINSQPTIVQPPPSDAQPYRASDLASMGYRDQGDPVPDGAWSAEMMMA